MIVSCCTVLGPLNQVRAFSQLEIAFAIVTSLTNGYHCILCSYSNIHLHKKRIAIVHCEWAFKNLIWVCFLITKIINVALFCFKNHRFNALRRYHVGIDCCSEQLTSGLFVVQVYSASKKIHTVA